MQIEKDQNPHPLPSTVADSAEPKVEAMDLTEDEAGAENLALGWGGGGKSSQGHSNKLNPDHSCENYVSLVAQSEDEGI